MNITEKIFHDNHYEIKLYKEGVFWIAYEQSAYYIWQKKGYKATKKLIKTLGKEIVSVGFPQSSCELLMTTITLVLEKDETHFKVFSLDEAIDTEAFLRWKAALPLAHERQAASVKPQVIPVAEKCEAEEPSGKDTFFQKLRDFPLENKTPMECMMFLSELKKICLNGNL
jgi:hypothetical protein